MKRVTIKSIAADLGISHMTVSRALSNHPNVLPQTRETVLQYAAKVGYVRSAAAAAMRGDGTRIVGLLLPNIVNEFYARFANTLALACQQNAFHLVIHLTNDDTEVEREALRRLQEVQAMAVVMVPAPNGQIAPAPYPVGMRVIELIRRRDTSAVARAILIEDRQAIAQAVAHLARQGHRQVAFIGADAVLSSGRARLEGFREGLAASGLAEESGLVLTGAPSFAMGRECAQRIVAEGRATALICGGFDISNGALTALLEHDAGLRAPAFVGYGDPSFYTWLAGGISTIQVPVEQLAQRAVEILGTDETTWSGTDSFPAKLVLRPQPTAQTIA